MSAARRFNAVTGSSRSAAAALASNLTGFAAAAKQRHNKSQQQHDKSQTTAQ